MIKTEVALKVDVDTYVGTRDGVPRLLEILERQGIRATFYFSLGPDNSGKAIRRIFKRGFLKKMLRTNAPSTYGLKTMLYGTLLPPPMIGDSLCDVMRKAREMGHEVGIHCWDHVRWHDLLPQMTREEAAKELRKACGKYVEIFGELPKTTAAPGWMVTADSLALQDDMSLSYCSDSRGYYPFYPVFGRKDFATLQIPTTLPTMDELIGCDGVTAENINENYLVLIRPGLNVHTIHAEMEGMSMSHIFSDLLDRLVSRGVRFVTLAEAAQAATALDTVQCTLNMAEIRGRACLVAVQGERLAKWTGQRNMVATC